MEALLKATRVLVWWISIHVGVLGFGLWAFIYRSDELQQALRKSNDWAQTAIDVLGLHGQLGILADSVAGGWAILLILATIGIGFYLSLMAWNWAVARMWLMMTIMPGIAHLFLFWLDWMGRSGQLIDFGRYTVDSVPPEWHSLAYRFGLEQLSQVLVVQVGLSLALIMVTTLLGFGWSLVKKKWSGRR